MTFALAVRRPSPWLARGAVAGALAAVVAVALSWVAPGGDAAAPDRDAAAAAGAAAYEAALEPHLQDAGFVVAQGVRPGVGDVEERSLPDDVLATMASGWIAELQAARAAVAAVPHAAALDEVAAAFDRALAAYVEVAEVLREAIAADGAARQALIDRVTVLGPAADDLYDAAVAALSARVAPHDRGAAR